jgi:hypothetical protein
LVPVVLVELLMLLSLEQADQTLYSQATLQLEVAVVVVVRLLVQVD